MSNFEAQRGERHRRVGRSDPVAAACLRHPRSWHLRDGTYLPISLARCVEVSVRERALPRTCSHACAPDHAAGGGGVPGERVRGSPLRPGRRRRLSERRRDASLSRPSVLSQRALSIRCRCARHEKIPEGPGRNSHLLHPKGTPATDGRHLGEVTRRDASRGRSRHDGVTGTRYYTFFPYHNPRISREIWARVSSERSDCKTNLSRRASRSDKSRSDAFSRDRKIRFAGFLLRRITSHDVLRFIAHRCYIIVIIARNRSA